MARPIEFFSRKQKFSELSNFVPFGFEADGLHWPTVEHYFQAQKCYAFESSDELHMVLEGLLSDRILFVVVMDEDDWVETTLIHRGEKPSVEKNHIAHVVSWSGAHDRFVGRR